MAPPPPAFQPGESVRIEKMGVMRKKIAEHMVMSIHTSPHVYSAYEVDFSRIDQLAGEEEGRVRGGRRKAHLHRVHREGDRRHDSPVSVLERVDRRREHRLQARHQSGDRRRARDRADRARDQERRRTQPARAVAGDSGPGEPRADRSSSSRKKCRAARSRSRTPESSARCSGCRSSASRRSRSWASAASTSAWWSWTT